MSEHSSRIPKIPASEESLRGLDFRLMIHDILAPELMDTLSIAVQLGIKVEDNNAFCHDQPRFEITYPMHQALRYSANKSEAGYYPTFPKLDTSESAYASTGPRRRLLRRIVGNA